MARCWQRISWRCRFFLLLFVASQLHAEILQFENPPSLGTFFLGTYIEQGFQFSGPKHPSAVNGGGLLFFDSEQIVPNPDPNFYERPVNGSRYVASFSAAYPLLQRVDGGLFSLVSLDLAEYSSVQTQPIVTVIGESVFGGAITNSFSLDGHVDSLAEPPDFQTFTFGPEWTDLLSVRFLAVEPTFGPVPCCNSFDNIVVTTPEPGVLSLVALASTLVWSTSRKRWAS